MFDVTMTHIYMPTYLWKNLPFWVHDKIKDEFKDDMFMVTDDTYMEEYKDWTYVQLSSTRDNKALNFIKDLIPTFAAKVDHDDSGYIISYAQRNGDEIYSEMFSGRGEGSSDDNDQEEDESEDGLADASYDARRIAIRAIERIFDNTINNMISLRLNDDEYNLILKKIGVDGVSKAIKIANNKKIDDIYLIACMRYIASSGVKEDVDELDRFYIEETPFGDPIMYDSKSDTRYSEYRIISKKDKNIINEIPGNVFLVKESEIKRFNSKGKEAIDKCISSNKDYLFSSDKWFCVNRKTHKNAPKWLKINDVYFDVLLSDVTTETHGELGYYKHCNKIFCNGKELQYLIVGHDRTGMESFQYMLIMYTGDFIYVPVKEKYIFDYCYCERSEKYSGSVQSQWSRYEDMINRDICRVENTYAIDDIFSGLANINGVHYHHFRDIKSVTIKRNIGVIIKKDGSKVEFKLK